MFLKVLFGYFISDLIRTQKKLHPLDMLLDEVQEPSTNMFSLVT
ncbi:hypothetical protein HMPREF0444_1454 [Granulicatella adiacens ATCC 49175]|uniref:Uncharacterized protein n=1 Tax=Granulicatella adiacens ATCC 49175 TaxID=638301 RepID=C8NHQ9_9LACT|nr:hypothetical protein HMPREF0444_1454 [Granulicatella adiacens ATCC 49175]